MAYPNFITIFSLGKANGWVAITQFGGTFGIGGALL
jgi:hypothetical protein